MKSCKTCVNGLANRNACEHCLTVSKGASFDYRNYEEGDPRALLLEMQRSGRRNIVLGGEGEHEVNATWAIDTAYRTLSHVCEMCGGLCWKENPTTLIVDKPYGGAFTLEYERIPVLADLKLVRIYKETKQQPKKLWWTQAER